MGKVYVCIIKKLQLYKLTRIYTPIFSRTYKLINHSKYRLDFI